MLRRINTIVSTTDLHRRYGEGPAAVDALAGVSLEIARGGFTAIMGASGSGKSTLMHLMAGLDKPTSGSVHLDGVDLAQLDDKHLTELRRDRVGFVFQAFNLLPVLTAEENLVLPLTIAGRKPDAAWLASLVETVGLADRLTHRPSELSGGQQQRVAVARALVSKPAVVFADEPTGNLDSNASAEVLPSCAAPSTSSSRPSSSSPTTRPRRPTPTGSSCSPTGASRRTRRPARPTTSSTS